MPALTNEFQAQVTPYQYIGDEPSFGSLQLTMLARSFNDLAIGDLDVFFPPMMVNERTLIVEQLIEGHAIMPPAVAGIPNGQFLEPNRLRRFSVTPQIFREDDSIEQMYVNQLREPGTINTQRSAQDWIARRMQMMVNRHRRTKSIFQAKMLLGGWKYFDQRTKVGIDVSSNIPAHNFFSYNGWQTAEAADTDIDVMGRSYRTLNNLTPKGRTEAAFFTSTDYRIGTPWTYPQADIVRGLQLMLNYLYITNKNKYTHIVMNSQLLSVITAVNEYLKTWQGFPGMAVINQPESAQGVAGNTALAASNNRPGPQHITFGPGGEITSIAGLKIVVLDGIWKNPANDNKLEVYWPAHKVALVAANSMSDPGATLGYTYHCSGEAKDGSPGLWVRSSEDAPLPSPPGLKVQMGDCFVPFPVYPHWIALLDVCEPEDLYTSLPILPDLGYGTF